MQPSKTPYGEECWAEIDEDSRLGTLIMSQARRHWQRSVIRNLLRNGYIIGYQADGSTLKGKAKSYQSSYAKSLYNLMDRVTQVVLDETPYHVVHGATGPKGGFGYYISEVR